MCSFLCSRLSCSLLNVCFIKKISCLHFSTLFLILGATFFSFSVACHHEMLLKPLLTLSIELNDKKALKIVVPRAWCTKNLSVIESHTMDPFIVMSRTVDSVIYSSSSLKIQKYSQVLIVSFKR